MNAETLATDALINATKALDKSEKLLKLAEEALSAYKNKNKK